MKAVVPGSFDPFTLGHLDVVTRAAGLFPDVVVAVGSNPAKRCLFSAGVRLEMALGAVASLPNVQVMALDGLLADFCRARGATVIVRGARSGTDFDAELAMSAMNASLGRIETVILPAGPAVSFISSTLVRSVIQAGGDASPYVPSIVAESIQKEL